MYHYIKLRWTLFHRRLDDYGIYPIIFYVLAPILFIGISLMLFVKIEYAQFLIAAIAIYFQYEWIDIKRNTFLKNQFSSKVYRKLRHIEHAAIALPFVLVLFFKGYWIHALAIIVSSILFPYLSLRKNGGKAWPSVFARQPFEFLVGTRKTWPVLLLAFVLIGIAVYVDNFKLGLFGLIIMPLTALSYYSEPEHSYYMWIHSHTPKQFIHMKVKQAFAHNTLLLIPGALILALGFPDQILTMLSGIGLSYFYLLTLVLAKYSVYPRFIHLGMVIIITISFLIPFFLLLLIPFYYKNSILNLRTQLS